MTSAATDPRSPESLPGWWQPLLRRIGEADARLFRSAPVPEAGGRPSAVLVLLGERWPGAGPDVLLLERAADLRHHAGQPAFPGGAREPGDRDAASTALREAQEEVGLDPATTRVLATLPPLWIAVSRFVVTPVLAWWRSPHPVHARQPAEVARVARVPVAELADPANRVRVRHPSGRLGAGFRVQGMLVWGFTGGVLSALLDLAGWSRPWSHDAQTVDLPVAGDRPVP